MNKIVIAFTLIVILAIVYVVMQPRRKDPVVKLPDIVSEPTSPPPSPTIDLSRLQMTDDVIGTGDEAISGKRVSIQYRGSLADGSEFDSSYSRLDKDGNPTPLTFILGAGQMIPGFDAGVKGMRVGGTRTLTIPPELGYGSQEVGGGLIPANSTLTFTVELVKVE